MVDRLKLKIIIEFALFYNSSNNISCNERILLIS